MKYLFVFLTSALCSVGYSAQLSWTKLETPSSELNEESGAVFAAVQAITFSANSGTLTEQDLFAENWEKSMEIQRQAQRQAHRQKHPSKYNLREMLIERSNDSLTTPDGDVVSSFRAVTLCDDNRKTYQVKIAYVRTTPNRNKDWMQKPSRKIDSITYTLVAEEPSPEEKAKAEAEKVAREEAETALIRAYKPRTASIASADSSAGPSTVGLKFYAQRYSSFFVEPFAITFVRGNVGDKPSGPDGGVLFSLSDVTVFNSAVVKWDDWRQKARANSVQNLEKEIDRTIAANAANDSIVDVSIVYVFSVNQEGKCALKIIGRRYNDTFSLLLVENEVMAFRDALNNLAGDVRQIRDRISGQIEAQKAKTELTEKLFK